MFTNWREQEAVSMKVNGRDYRAVWMQANSVFMIDQTKLPDSFEIFESQTFAETASAIKRMVVRGAGSIEMAAAFGMVQAFLERKPEEGRDLLEKTRPTAVGLFKSVKRVCAAGAANASKEAGQIAFEVVEACRKIGEFGEPLIPDGATVETHCNAGWLALGDWGSALAPVYLAHKRGKKIRVLVGETRPRLQGARLTAWELANEGVDFKIISDSMAAHFMSKGETDLVLIGADRIAANGDTANKIGSLHLAIAAKHYGVPFYVAAPSGAFDFASENGGKIKIEERDEDEVLHSPDGSRLAASGAHALNPAFDVTPAGLISGFITEKGVLEPSQFGVLR